MSSRSHSTSFRRSAVAVVAALCLPLGASAPAFAGSGDSRVPSSTAQVESYGDAHDGYGQMRGAIASNVGDTQADFGNPPVVEEPKVGDTPVDFPGASRAPETQPTPPIEIVRPERTIVRDDAPVLPIVLAGLALLIALAGGAMVLAQRRTLRARVP
jgi:hypothetical protein